MEKNECRCQRTHVQNHVYANESRHAYVRDVHQLLTSENRMLNQFL